MKLVQPPTRVEAPFITVVIAGYAFGKYSRKVEKVVSPVDGFTKRYIEYFPNFVTSVDVTKVNGTVNTYSINLVYQVRDGDDPNKIDKILSNASSTRRLTISYGDYNLPTFIYKEEEALITKVTQNLQMESSKITYTITAVSAVKLATEGSYNFSKKTAKPSDELKRLLREKKYGLQDIFYGMRNYNKVLQLGLIASDDKVVTIQAKQNISIFDYMAYLVSCMTSLQDSTNGIKGRHKYTIAVVDDTTGELAGPYFKVQQIATNIQETNTIGLYELDIGFPDAQAVTSFSMSTDDSYSILYNYGEKQKQTEYSYKINDRGEYEYVYAPPLLKSKQLYVPTEQEKTWWAQVTQYPVQATVTIKGLLRPAVLMSYVKVTCLFYGRKYNASGMYIITKQQDRIDENGYRTTLNLVRIGGSSLEN